MENAEIFRNKKVITIGIVSELTGLSVRKIRYYEERGLLFPDRTETGNRKYSFADVELLVNIADQLEEGVQTFEIKQELKKARNQKSERKIRNDIIKGQLNAHFGLHRK